MKTISLTQGKVVTQRQNLQNLWKKKTSIFPGVYLKRSHKKWVWASTITLNRKRNFLGYFPTEELAFAAYQTACVRIGEAVL